MVQEYPRLRDYVGQVMTAGETGDFTQVPWIERADDPGAMSEIKKYEAIMTQCIVIARCATGLRETLLPCAAFKDSQTLKRITEIATNSKEASQNVEQMKEHLFTVMLGNVLCVSPRPPNHAEQVKQVKDLYMKNVPMATREKMPRYFAGLLKASNSEPEVVADTPVETTIVPASASTLEGSSARASASASTDTAVEPSLSSAVKGFKRRRT